MFKRMFQDVVVVITSARRFRDNSYDCHDCSMIDQGSSRECLECRLECLWIDGEKSFDQERCLLYRNGSYSYCKNSLNSKDVFKTLLNEIVVKINLFSLSSQIISVSKIL